MSGIHFNGPIEIEGRNRGEIHGEVVIGRRIDYGGKIHGEPIEIKGPKDDQIHGEPIEIKGLKDDQIHGELIVLDR
ncbi:hypothetical protein [Shimazuella kribbensis]|uniref:hypothetical protein n=1 Tax=Shimazuella kribbensis TaxID=139808 RepID=UPI0004243FC3|nr:hypothetical protein [Shimazuella kribbensis]